MSYHANNKTKMIRTWHQLMAASPYSHSPPRLGIEVIQNKQSNPYHVDVGQHNRKDKCKSAATSENNALCRRPVFNRPDNLEQR